jgi:DNA-binding NtrC family response regulator
MALRTKALGVAPAALAEMLDYDWPLNDVELESTLSSLVQVATGDSVTDLDLERIAFRPLQQSLSPSTDSEGTGENRRRPRAAPHTARPRDR